MKFKELKKKIQKIGLIKKSSFFGFIKKKLNLIGFVLILIVIGVYFLFSSSEATAEWWDTNWHYRNAITVSNSGSVQTDFQIKALDNYDMSTEVTNGKVQADFDDLRFTDINGSSFDYWIEDNTASSLDVWIKVSSIPAGDSTVYMYYGNSDAVATSNPIYIVGTSVNPGVSCTEIKNDRDCLSGIYYIDTDGGSLDNEFQVYCDMIEDGGGWTFIIHAVGGTSLSGYATTEEYEIDQSTNLNGTTFKFSDAIINAIKSGSTPRYRVHTYGTYSYKRFWDATSTYGHKTVCSGTNLWSYSDVDLTTDQHGGNSGGDMGICDYNGTGLHFQAKSDPTLSTTWYFGPGTSYTAVSSGSSSTNHARVWVRESAPVSYGVSVGIPQPEEESLGLLAYWSFDEGYGTTAQDRTSNNNDGTISSATWQTEDQCIAGKCLYFDGTNDYVNTFDYSMDYNNDSTFSLWFKPVTVDTGGKIKNLISKNSYEYMIAQLDSGIRIIHWSSIGGDAISYTVTSILSANRWHYLTFVYDGSEEKSYVYLNGKLISSKNNQLTSFKNNSYDMIIGAGYGWSGSSVPYFNGFIDEVKIYDYARTDAQIKADYNSKSSVHGSAMSLDGRVSPGTSSDINISDGLVGYWRMDEKLGSAIDSSGNGNTGIWNGAGSHYLAGKFGNGSSFNGSDDYIAMANSDCFNFGDGDFSIGMWIFKPQASSSYGGILTKGFLEAYGIYDTTRLNDELGLYIQSGGDHNGINISSYYNEWVYVVWTVDNINNIQKSYLNGVFNNQTNHNVGNITSVYDLNIGRYVRSTNQYFGGRIDEVRIYNRTLSDREINTLYEWAPGPIAHWKMDEASWSGNGAVKDVSGNSNSLTHKGNATIITPGKYGKGSTFDGAEDYLCSDTDTDGTCDDNGDLDFGTGNFTMGLWVKLTMNGPFDLISKRSGVDNAIGYILACNSSESFTLEIDDGVGHEVNSSSSTLINDGIWHYLTAVKDNNIIYVYVDGIPESSADVSLVGTISNSIDFEIGRNGDGSQDASGLVDDVRIYNYARTQKQILEDMNASRPAQKSPVGYWKFDEGYGTSAKDSGDQENNGTITGTTWANEGKFNKALSFNGISDYVTIPQISIDKDKSWSFSVWQYKPTGSETSWQGFIGRSTGITGGYWMLHPKVMWYQDYYDPGTGYEYYGYQNSNIELGDEIPYDEWYNLTVTYNGDNYNIKIYVNGEFLESGISTWSPRPVTQFTFEWVGRGGTSRYFEGKIDEVKVYNYTLNEEEIKREYNQGKVAVIGALSSNDTIGGHSSSLEYCIPGSSDLCSPPIAKWDFGEYSGTFAYDSSENENTGTIINMEESDWTIGKIGSALEFDGGVSDEYISVQDNTILKPEKITIEAWVKMTDDTARRQLFLVKWNGYSCETDTSHRPFLRIANGGDSPIGPVLVIGEWYHFVGVYDPSPEAIYQGNTLYINGKRIGTTTNNGSISHSSNILTIGKYQAGYHWGGLVDQIQIYNYARTPAQVAWDYDKGKPVAHYKMDKGYGIIIYDSSENGNNGILNLGSLDQISAGSTKVSGNTAWYNGRDGKQNYSLNFDGDDDYVTIIDPPNEDLDFGTNDFSVETWFKTTGSSSLDSMIDKYKTNTEGERGYILGVYNGNLVTYLGSGAPTITGSDVDNDIWHHAVAVRSGDNAYLYLDGLLDNSTSGISSNNASSTGNLYIGTEGGGSSYIFDGQIDEVKIFNYALTPLQIKTEYNMGAARLGTGE